MDGSVGAAPVLALRKGVTGQAVGDQILAALAHLVDVVIARVTDFTGGPIISADVAIAEQALTELTVAIGEENITIVTYLTLTCGLTCSTVGMQY